MPAIRQDQTLLRLIRDVNEIRSALRRVTVNLPLFDIANENTPNQITADQDNYVIGNYDVLKLSSFSAVTMSGFRGGVKGRYLKVFNIGNYAITLSHEDASSDPENRFSFAPQINTIIPAGSSIVLYYDADESRWIEGLPLEGSTIFKESSVIITADQDNYDTGYDLIFASSDAPYAFSGFTGGVGGRMITIYNYGDFSLSLNHEDASSDAENRLITPIGKPLVISPNQVARIYYDDNIQRWHVEGGGGYGFQEIAIVQQNSNQTFPSSSDDVIEWDNPPDVDQGEWFNAANNSFVVNSDGFYRGTLLTSLTDVGGAGDRYDTASVRINTVVYASDRRQVNNDAYTKFMNVTFPVLELSAGDEITFSFEQLSGGDRSFNFARASFEKIG